MTDPLRGVMLEVPLDQIQEFGTAPTLEEMRRDFDLMGSCEAWSKRCGEKQQHSEEIWKAVNDLIMLGTSHANPNDYALQGMRVLCPTATAAQWWIFSNSDLAGDVRLYHEIQLMLGPELRDPRPSKRAFFSMGVLSAVSNKLGRESAEVMAAHFAALDAIDAVGQPNTTTSTSTKVIRHRESRQALFRYKGNTKRIRRLEFSGRPCTGTPWRCF